jgi:hypothetical protein
MFSPAHSIDIRATPQFLANTDCSTGSARFGDQENYTRAGVSKQLMKFKAQQYRNGSFSDVLWIGRKIKPRYLKVRFLVGNSLRSSRLSASRYATRLLRHLTMMARFDKIFRLARALCSA